MPKTEFHQLADEVASLVAEKNRSYGDSFDTCGEFLKLLWPSGVPPDRYTDMLALVRIFDKMKRLATDEHFGGEEPAKDLLGYSLLLLRRKRAERQPSDDELPSPLPGC